jgi:MFS transporter, DHA3 family, multidrug efflux protein
MTAFYHILANNLVAGITNFTVWFAVTFWAYLETQSVLVTGVIGGIYLILTAGSGIWFGSIVDHNSKRRVMLGSSIASFVLYSAALAVLFAAPAGSLEQVGSVWLWSLILLSMVGVICGNIRNIAIATLVTLMIPEDRRDRANGLVGMVSGVGFLTTSVISGFLVAWGGMLYALVFALGFTAICFLHLLFVKVDETAGVQSSAANPDEPPAPKRVDIAGTIQVVAAVPGLFALIFFTCFNNFLGGTFMALADAYGLSLVSVEVWGLLLGAMSSAFILSGIIIAKTGLGKNPVRTLMLVNIVVWSVSAVFTIQHSLWLLIGGFFIWMLLAPFAEASEHTTLQKVVPYERQGRVFGFAQSIEQAASPLTAFLIGPLTQFVFIPFMTTGLGAQTIGGWFGTGPARGIALVFTVAGVIGLIVTILAFNSKYYRQLSDAYAKGGDDEDDTSGAAPVTA